MESFHTTLKELRIARTLTQADMATLLGCAQQVYARWEQGHRLPPKSRRARIAAILGASEREIFGDVPVEWATHE